MSETPDFMLITLTYREDAEEMPDEWRGYLREAITVLALARALWGIERVDVEDRELACRMRLRPRPNATEGDDAPRRQRRARRALARPH